MNFVAVFFLAVVVLAVSELYLLVHAAAAIGFAATLGLCVLTGVVGGALVRHQGLKTLARMQEELAHGRLPAGEILEGLVLLVVGALLCVPGFITDVAGGLLLVPPLRRAGVARLRGMLADRVRIHTGGFGGPPPGGPAPPGGDDVVDVEVTDIRDVEGR